MNGFGTAAGYGGGTRDQPRVRVGDPGAGRFAPTIHGEPDVSLTELSDEEYNADGTFGFPPVPRSAAQHVAFWSRVPVSDSILMRVHDAYIARWKEWSAEEMIAWVTLHPHPSSARGRTDSAVVAAWQARRAAALDELMVRRPPTIERPLVRTIVRATQMCRFAEWLEPESEFEKVLDHEMDLGDDKSITVRGIVDRYLMRELELDDFEDPATFVGLNAASAVTALNEMVDRMRAEDGEP